MNVVPISRALYLRQLTEGVAYEVQRLGAACGKRLSVNDNHMVDSYARTLDALADRVMAKTAAFKEAVLEMKGEKS